MTLKTNLIIIGCVLGLLAGSHIYAYRSGWSAHADKINNEARKKKDKAEVKLAVVEDSQEKERIVIQTKYKVINHDVIKYVKDPHIKCDFDSDSIRLRQSAIDAANSVSKPKG